MNIFDEVAKINDFRSKLMYVHDNMNSSNISDCAKVTSSLEVKRFVMFMISKKLKADTFTDDDYVNIQLLVDILQAIDNYSSIETGVSDEDFDVLFEILEDADLDKITTRIISDNKISHHTYKYLRGTLEKVFSLEEDESTQNKSRKGLIDWINKMNNTKGVDISKDEVYVFPKWNGISVIHEFDENNNLVRSLTRGYTELNEAEDVTSVFKKIENRIRDNSPYTKNTPYGLKTEVIVPDDVFEKYNSTAKEPFKSARSMCNSIILSDWGGEDYLEIKKLRVGFINNGVEQIPIMAEDAFNEPYIRCSINDANNIRKFANDHKKTSGCDCDGIVLRVINEDKENTLGYKNDKPCFEVAYKFNEEIAYTKITDIIFQIGSLGRMSPVACFEPVKMKGNTVSHSSLGSYQRFIELGLSKGDTVKILYEIIPYMIFDKNDPKCKKSNNPIIEAPKVCPDCGTPFDLTSTEPRCENPECPCRKRGKILNYVRKMNIKQLDSERIYNLYEANIITSIKDLYRLKKKKELIIHLPKFGEKTFNNILHDIDACNKVPASRVLGSLGIRGAGRTNFQAILRVFTVDEILEFAETKNIQAFTVVRGIKNTKAETIVDGLNENISLIKFLMKELTIIPEDNSPVRFKVCFTKTRSAEISKLIESKNGKVIDNVTKDCDLLITLNSSTTSSSVDSAKKYGIPIIPVHDAIEYINSNWR